MIEPKVLIVTTIYEDKDYALQTFLAHVRKFTYKNYRHIFVDNSKTKDYWMKLKRMGLEAYHVERGNNSREALSRSSNFALRKALDGNYDYFFSLESDIYAPPHTIQQLIGHYKDCVTGLYMLGDRSKGIRHPCVTIPKWNEELKAWGTRMLGLDEVDEFKNGGLQRVQAGGFGCCMVDMDVFRDFDIKFTYDIDLTGHPDIYFFNKLFLNRIPVFVDADLYCEHENSRWDEVEDR